MANKHIKTPMYDCATNTNATVPTSLAETPNVGKLRKGTGTKKPKYIFHLKCYAYVGLKSHANLQNSRTTPSGRRVTGSEREKIAINRGYSVLPARDKCSTCSSLEPN
jgi:hypothetical protein